MFQQVASGSSSPTASRKMFFITGASRSGTTLLSFVLRNHSQVLGLNELHYFGDCWHPQDGEISFGERRSLAAVASILSRQEHGVFCAKPSERNLEDARLFISLLPNMDRTASGVFAATTSQLAAEAGKVIPCEQTPRNIFYAEALLRTYPEARFIHMMRDPRAVMASQKSRWKRRKLAANKAALPVHETLRSWVNYHPYTMADLWLRASMEARRLSSHPRFTVVRFEDLLRTPEPTVRSLCKSLDIEFEPQMLDVSQINSSHQSSVGGARKGFHTDAADSWKTTLNKGEIAIAERVCGRIMQQYGYSPKEETPPRISGEARYALTYLIHVVAAFAVNPRRAWIQLRAALRVPRVDSAPATEPDIKI